MKKLFLVLALGASVASGAFAQLTLGVTGVQYFDKDTTSVGDAFNNLKDGVGVYYGGFVEIIGRNMGLGVSFNFVPQPVNEGYSSTFDMMDYDVNVYLSYHLFGGRAFLDPFLTLGIGMRAYDYKDKKAAISELNAIWPYDGTYYINEDSPLYASMYWDAGLGLGVNLGPLGIFVKGAYNMNINDAVKGKAGNSGYDYMGVYYAPGEEFVVQPWIVSNFKWIFGAKLIL